MNISNRAVLTFNSNIGEVVRVSIPRANMDITPENAQTAMQAMITAQTVLTGNGNPLTVRGAELISTNRSPIITAG